MLDFRSNPRYYISRLMGNTIIVWGISAVGSAPQWHCGGQEFESPMLHQATF